MKAHFEQHYRRADCRGDDQMMTLAHCLRSQRIAVQPLSESGQHFRRRIFIIRTIVAHLSPGLFPSRLNDGGESLRRACDARSSLHFATDGCGYPRISHAVCSAFAGHEEVSAMRHKPILDTEIAYTMGVLGLGLLPISNGDRAGLHAVTETQKQAACTAALLTAANPCSRS